jgi:hypothetical protein
MLACTISQSIYCGAREREESTLCGVCTFSIWFNQRRIIFFRVFNHYNRVRANWGYLEPDVYGSANVEPSNLGQRKFYLTVLKCDI